MSTLYITIKKNSDNSEDSKRFSFNVHENFQDILSRIGAKLGIEAKKLYTESGDIVDEAGDIRDKETIYVSQGEKFFKIKEEDKPVALPLFGKKKDEKTFKFGLFGGTAVGKSTLSIRYVRNYFRMEYNPSIEDMYNKTIIIEGKRIGLDILDITGMEEFVVMRPMWYKQCESFIMVYAINSRDSFNEIAKSYDELRNYKPEGFDLPPPKKGKPDNSVTIVLVGNKSDLEGQREVTKEEGMALAKSMNAQFFETSAKKNTNVNEVFETLAKTTLHKKFPKKGCLLL